MADLELLSLDKVTPQIIAPKSSDRGVVVTGSLLSDVPDAGTAIGWTLDNPVYVAAGAKLLSLKNGGVEKFSIDKDGKLSSDPSIQIVINSLSDFAVQDTTTITLEAFKTYICGAPISTSKRFIVQTGVSIIGTNLIGHIWEYTGTGSMFTGTDLILLNIQSFAFKCTLGTAFDFTDVSEQSTLNFRDIISIDLAGGVSVNKFAKFTNVDSVIFNNIGGLGVNDGISLEGATAGFILMRDIAFGIPTDINFIGFNLNSVVVSNFLSIRDFQVEGISSTTTGISGLVSSANVASGVIGKITNCEFTGTITPLTNISESDIRWEITDSSPIADSTKTADSFLISPETVTISSIGVFVAINGSNWSSDISERFSTTSAGLITYLSPISTKSQVLITATIEKDGGGSDEIELAIAINGTESTKTIGATENMTPTTVSSLGLFTLTTNDTIQAFVANRDGTSDIIVSRCSISVVNGF